MKEASIKDLLESHLSDKGFNSCEIETVLENYSKGVKQVQKDRREAEKKEEAEIRHGTSCIGIVTKNKVLVEW